ncbi:hypothetical protein V0288_05160 [Pannus brasiliensis CCIBt3594]|uniref:Uncharacterized protein n=1 Tax=Pannus brasiliensis CCIBt3594 TaxID=1427578 RepID=A0AAW9QFG2_9CHRO
MFSHFFCKNPFFKGANRLSFLLGRQEAGGRRQEAGGRRQEAGGRRQEAGGRRERRQEGSVIQ